MYLCKYNCPQVKTQFTTVNLAQLVEHIFDHIQYSNPDYGVINRNVVRHK